jgi:hypothetical protein
MNRIPNGATPRCMGRYSLQVHPGAGESQHFLDITNLICLVGVKIRGPGARVPSVYVEKI